MSRELDHKRRAVRPEMPEGVTRRQFFKLGGTAALSAAVLLGCGSSLPQVRTEPRAAPAEASPRRIEDLGLRTITLDRSLRDLDQETERFRGHERFPSGQDATYSIDVVVPEEVAFLVSINNQEARRGLVVSIPTRSGPLRVDLNDFAIQVREVTGQELSRVRIILERGNESLEGREVPYTNAYIFPVDAEGRVTTGRSDGRYMIYGATKIGDSVQGANTYIVAEPEGRNTIALAEPVSTGDDRLAGISNVPISNVASDLKSFSTLKR